MVATYGNGGQGPEGDVDYHLVVTLPGSQAEEEMPASAKVAPEPEAEPQAEAWYGEQEPGAEPTVEGAYIEMEPERYEMEPER